MNMTTLFFSVWMVSDLHRSLTLMATINGIASVMVVVSIPFFGAISDETQRRKPWVVGFTLVACAATVIVALIGQNWLPLTGEGVDGVNSAARLGSSMSLPLFAVLFAYVVANYTYQGRSHSSTRCCRNSFRHRNGAGFPEWAPRSPIRERLSVS